MAGNLPTTEKKNLKEAMDQVFLKINKLDLSGGKGLPFFTFQILFHVHAFPMQKIFLIYSFKKEKSIGILGFP